MNMESIYYNVKEVKSRALYEKRFKGLNVESRADVVQK